MAWEVAVSSSNHRRRRLWGYLGCGEHSSNGESVEYPSSPLWSLLTLPHPSFGLHSRLCGPLVLLSCRMILFCSSATRVDISTEKPLPGGTDVDAAYWSGNPSPEGTSRHGCFLNRNKVDLW